MPPYYLIYTVIITMVCHCENQPGLDGEQKQPPQVLRVYGWCDIRYTLYIRIRAGVSKKWRAAVVNCVGDTLPRHNRMSAFVFVQYGMIIIPFAGLNRARHPSEYIYFFSISSFERLCGLCLTHVMCVCVHSRENAFLVWVDAWKATLRSKREKIVNQYIELH